MITTPDKQVGFSIIELMISMVIGLVLIGSMVTAFSSSQRSVALNSTLTQLQDNGRFAMDSMIRDARMAGFQGCIDINSASATIRSDTAPTENFYDTAVQASTITNTSAFDPPMHPSFIVPTDVGKPIPGTDAISLQFGSPLAYTFIPMSSADSDIVLDNAESDFVTGDIALISNCQVADIFTITNSSGASLQHTALGNKDRLLSAPYGSSGEGNLPRLMRFEANIYYIGDTTRTNSSGDPIHSLYKQTLPYTNPPIEMIEGVANLKIKLGLRDPDPTSERLRFVAPDEVNLFDGQIELVQFGILVQSYNKVLTQDELINYSLAGYTLTPSKANEVDAAIAYAADGRMKLAFNATVSIRNRR